MKMISPFKFKQEYLTLVGKLKFKDLHYFHEAEIINHKELFSSIKSFKVWSVILYGSRTQKIHKDLPVIFRHLPMSWAQFFFINDGKVIKIFRGSSLGSGYRYTHGIMANAFSLINRKKRIKTFVIFEGKRGGLYIYKHNSLKVHGHELRGNYPIKREELDKNIPNSIRIYSGFSLKKI